MNLPKLTGVALMSFAATVSAGINPDTVDFDSLNWKTSYEADNLVIYTAPVQGHHIDAFKAVSTYDATLHQVLNAVTDMETFTDWMAGAEESWVAKKLDANTQACYFRNDTPFPLKDRDGVIVQKVSRVSEKEVIVHLNLMNELVDEKSKYVRVDHLEGDWIIRELGANQVELTYQNVKLKVSTVVLC